MRHRRVPRAKWQDHVTATGKHWIDHIYSVRRPMVSQHFSDIENDPLSPVNARTRRETTTTQYRIPADVPELPVRNGCYPGDTSISSQHWARNQAGESGAKKRVCPELRRISFSQGPYRSPPSQSIIVAYHCHHSPCGSTLLLSNVTCHLNPVSIMIVCPLSLHILNCPTSQTTLMRSS